MKMFLDGTATGAPLIYQIDCKAEKVSFYINDFLLCTGIPNSGEIIIDPQFSEVIMNRVQELIEEKK